MNSQVCVTCCNKKAVNQTDNRLVTESCGHVKCMDCLLHEKSGCVACKENANENELADGLEPKISTEPVKTILAVAYQDLSKEEQIELEDLTVKKKVDISHIKIEKVGSDRAYVCTVCKKNFKARSQVSYHAYCNGQKKPYFCQSCKQSFISLSHYKYHMRVHSQERSYMCDICSTSFYQMSKLKRHKLKHTKEKNYKCNECDKAFNNISSLRKHTLTHTDERPYECPACSRRFRDSSNFKKHVNKHKRLCNSCGEELPVTKGEQHRCSGTGKGSRMHACPHCRKSFHSRKDMRRHAVTHSDSKPFLCKACPEERRFRRKDNIERHIRNAHPNFSPSTVLECDLSALEGIARLDAKSSENYEKSEKIRLEKINPLPPLPQELIEKHIEVSNDKEDEKQTFEPVVDKKSIIEANNARESVIVEKRTTEGDKRASKPENEYVHKIRKAIIPLPPIDQEKFRSVQRGHLPDNVSTAPITNMEIYKKILFEKAEKDVTEVIQNPKMHWRRKMEQDTK